MTVVQRTVRLAALKLYPSPSVCSKLPQVHPSLDLLDGQHQSQAFRRLYLLSSASPGSTASAAA